MPSTTYSSSNGTATIAYVAPFAVYVGLMALDHALVLPPEIFYPFRFLAVLLVLLSVSRRVITLGPSVPLATIGVGIAVFIIWIGPDVLFGYRHSWLFENSLMGSAASSLPPYLRSKIWFLTLRVLSSVALVPILEELFWRGWLMRWLINPEFQKVPLGQYRPASFWITAILFASEHGAYWEVGLAAGIIYNWWLVRCRNLADCIWAHAITNGLLAAYILVSGQWQYWL